MLDPAGSLRSYYQSTKARCAEVLVPFDGTDGYVASLPLLLCPTRAYMEAGVRIFFVGQETAGWDVDGIDSIGVFVERDDSVDLLSQLYESFNFGESRRGTPFWSFYHAMLREMGLDEKSGIWTNIVRCSVRKDGVSSCSPHGTPLEEPIRNYQHGMLAKEIDILAPQMIVFLTGPEYDGDIEKTFGKFASEKAVASLESNQFARLDLGLGIPCYRAYHPGYMNRFREAIWSPVMEHLVAEARTLKG